MSPAESSSSCRSFWPRVLLPLARNSSLCCLVSAVVSYFALVPAVSGQSPFTATATARVDNGFVVEINVTYGGRGYFFPPSVKIEGDGQGATARAFVTNGAVVEVQVMNAGSGYTQPPAVIFNSPAFPLISDIALVPRLTISGPIGSVIQIQYTENLGRQGPWPPLTNLVINSSPILFADVYVPPAPQRFYRVVNLSQYTPATDQSLLVWIPPGTFTMGSPSTEQDRVSNEGPLTLVTLTRGFWCSKYEVTQAQYEEIMGDRPSFFDGDYNLPVESVTWSDATNYCGRLTALMQAAGLLTNGYAFRLPSEAEWEYVCRAGTTNRFSFGDDPSYLELGTYSWFSDNAGLSTHPVGQKQPNPWGLYDMHGNVQEFCLDRYAATLLGGSVTNPIRGTTSTTQVRRGGSIGVGAQMCRSAVRGSSSFTDSRNFLGFRIILAPTQP